SQHLHAAGLGTGELQSQLVHLGPAQVRPDDAEIALGIAAPLDVTATDVQDDRRPLLPQRPRKAIDAVDGQPQLSLDVVELARSQMSAALTSIARIDEVADHRIIELETVRARPAQIGGLLDQDILDGAKEMLARGISARGMLR